MARVSTCFNFPRQTEEAFGFCRGVFGGDFNGPIHRFGDAPAMPGQPPLAEMFWGACFGSLTDRYGVRWMVNCAPPPQA